MTAAAGGAPARIAAVLAAMAVLAVACTRVSTAVFPSTAPGASGGTGELYAPDPVCDRPAVASPSPEPSAASLPPSIALVARQVQEVRGLSFSHPVVPEPVTQQRIGALLRQSLDQSDPKAQTDRTGQAWIAMGAIPPGTDLFQSLVDFSGSQVIGFYDPDAKRLVFVGSQTPDPYERVTLAHELTHALQDQRFGLRRLDELNHRCLDEQLQGAVGLVEGDAVVTSLQWAGRFLTPEEQTQLQEEAASFPPPPADVPPFLQRIEEYPYVAGPAFVQALQSRGGEAAVNAALRHPPVSTEQVLHPEKYPDDLPVPVAVGDLAARLGPGWSDLDLSDVGEEFLRALLALHLPETDAEQAAAGWNGARYRAWTEGQAAAVELVTEWETLTDASEFADALDRWRQGRPVMVEPRGRQVRVLFASDPTTLQQLRVAAG
jgi:hypothetical protein